MFGFKLHVVLNREKETTKICLNCHAVITVYLDPIMKLQSLMLIGQTQEKISDETRIKILQLFIIVVIAYLSLAKDYEQFSADDPNFIRRLLSKLRRSEEIRETIFDLVRKLERDQTCQKQLEARVTVLDA